MNNSKIFIEYPISVSCRISNMCKTQFGAENLNQCRLIINWTIRNKLWWNFSQKWNCSNQENAFENVVCEMAAILSRRRWVEGWYPIDITPAYHWHIKWNFGMEITTTNTVNRIVYISQRLNKGSIFTGILHQNCEINAHLSKYNCSNEQRMQFEPCVFLHRSLN